MYPSAEFKIAYDSNTPEKFAIIVASTFFLVALVFVIYDVLVYQRNNKIISSAARSNAIVTQLFPENIRDKLIGQDRSETNPLSPTSNGLNSFFVDGDVGDSSMRPLADLFLETTVIFADIAGFTAWSSVREPHQVFNLLECLYAEFDAIAKRRHVFKVESK